MTDSQKIYDQRGQTVYGSQTNVVGDQHIHLPPIQPTTATAPAPPPDFVGRDDQISQLTATVTAGKAAAITALHGMGGIGKTALAQQLAERLKPAFPGGIFWGDLALHGGSAETILRAWGAMCGADFNQEPDPAVLSERVRGLLAMRRETNGALLAVVDDVRAEWLDGAQLLQKSLPADTALLVTMRDVDLAVALDAEVVRLDVLPEPDARELLAARVKPNEILTPDEMVKALLQQLGYLPLAIRLAGGHISKFAAKPGFELSGFVAEVARRAVSLLDVAGGGGLAATFAISYEALSEAQKKVFRYCSVYAAPLLTVEHMAGLLAMEETTVEAVLDDLVEVALLDWDREVKGRYVLHPLLRQYGYETLQQEENAILLHRQAAIYLFSGIDRMGRFPDEVLEEVRQWQLAREWKLMARRAHRLIGTLDRYGYWDEIEVVLHSAQDSLSNVANHINSAWLLFKSVNHYLR
ncbi:MAG: AAA family ATPase [Caldilineaceae bacterium]|nr:AAA family ATPase [Caldilineaceae bacterium]